MAIDALYPNPNGSQFSEQHGAAFDDYMQGIPIPDIFNGAKQYGEERPLHGLEQLVDEALSSFQGIQTRLNSFAYSGGILKAVMEQYPEKVAQLSPDRQAAIAEIASRLGDIPTK